MGTAQDRPHLFYNQPLRMIGGGGGALPLPTKHPPKLIEAMTNTIASATFCMPSPFNGKSYMPNLYFSLYTSFCSELVHESHTGA
jgi:hypothetical protein